MSTKKLMSRLSKKSHKEDKEDLLERIAAKEETSLQEILVHIAGFSKDVSTVIEKYVLQDYKFKQFLNDQNILAENKEAEAKLNVLINTPKYSREDSRSSKIVNVLEKSPKMSDFKRNKHLTFYDGSLMYAKILEIFEKLYYKDSTDLTAEELRYYF